MDRLQPGDATRGRRMDESLRARGPAAWLKQLGRWWRQRSRSERRRRAKRRLFLLESVTLGPRQRVVLMRCGHERFLVGLGSDGVRTIVAVRAKPGAGAADRAGETQWV